MTTRTDQEQNRQLGDHRSRLADLEDRLNASFPTMETPTGAAQRIRFAVPTPHSILTIGARGTAVSEGRAIGPGGLAMWTEQNLGVEVQGSTCVSTVGLTLLHSTGAMGLTTHQLLSVAASDGVAMGTLRGPVEITAGRVEIPNPRYTVVPDADIPSEVPEVDVRGPRSTTETIRATWDGIFRTLRVASYGRTMLRLWRASTRGGSAPSIHPSIGRKLISLDGWLSNVRHALEGALAAADAADGASSDHIEDSLEPGVRIHARGDVQTTAGHKYEAFGTMGAYLSSPKKVALEGGLRAGVYSAVSAKLYGAMIAGVKSEAVAKVSAPLIGLSGDYVEMRAKQIAGVSSTHKVVVQSGGDVGVDAQAIAMGADTVSIGAATEAKVMSEGDSYLQASVMAAMYAGSNWATAESKVLCLGDQVLVQNNANGRIELRENLIRLNPGGSWNLIVEPDRLECGQFMVRRSETTIRGRVLLG